MPVKQARVHVHRISKALSLIGARSLARRGGEEYTYLSETGGGQEHTNLSETGGGEEHVP